MYCECRAAEMACHIVVICRSLLLLGRRKRNSSCPAAVSWGLIVSTWYRYHLCEISTGKRSLLYGDVTHLG